MSAAQLEPRPEMDAYAHTAAAPHASAYPAPDPDPEPFALRQQVAQRLASHRARRAHEPGPALTQSAPIPSAAGPRPTRVRNARIAGAVAERYAQAESYRSFLAAEAERSVRQAEAVAEVATINAKAIASAQQQMLADLDHWDLPADHAEPLSGTTSMAARNFAPHPVALSPGRPDIAAPASSSFVPDTAPAHYAYSVRLPDDVLRPRDTAVVTRREIPDEIDFAERSALDDEIAFRHTPVFEEAGGESLPLTANLIEFPRQLIAARKALPRLAEGPLREDAATTEAQLRIFEVDPAQIAAAAPAAAHEDAPEWSSILLAPQPAADYLPGDALVFHRTVVPQVAPISRRLMAATVDAAVVLATLVAAAGVFVQTAAHTGSHAALHVRWPFAAGVLAVSALLLGALYLVLFFSFGECTPGMRYARIALCTFSDENPARSAIRHRLLSTALSALPLGIGLLWAFVDEDTLSWHDRLSGMYQRSY